MAKQVTLILTYDIEKYFPLMVCALTAVQRSSLPVSGGFDMFVELNESKKFGFYYLIYSRDGLGKILLGIIYLYASVQSMTHREVYAKVIP